MLKELKGAMVETHTRETVYFPKDFWLDTEAIENPSQFTVVLDDFITFKPLVRSSNVTEVSTEEELEQLLKTHGLTMDSLSMLRLEVRETRTMGRKPVFINGNNSKKFKCELVVKHSSSYILLFGLIGTRSLESIYIHGVWKVDQSSSH